jgi:hypothetical protein
MMKSDVGRTHSVDNLKNSRDERRQFEKWKKMRERERLLHLPEAPGAEAQAALAPGQPQDQVAILQHRAMVGLVGLEVVGLVA